MVIANCIPLVFYRPCSPELIGNSSFEMPGMVNFGGEHSIYFSVLLAIVDYISFGYFVFEMFIRLIAMGVGKRNGYFMNIWNIVDIIIIISGYIKSYLK